VLRRATLEDIDHLIGDCLKFGSAGEFIMKWFSLTARNTSLQQLHKEPSGLPKQGVAIEGRDRGYYAADQDKTRSSFKIGKET